MKRFAFAFVMIGMMAMSMRLTAGILVQFRTAQGDMQVELFDQDKPKTVENFVRLVKSNAYTNTFFHRCLPGFVVQGGGVAVASKNTPGFFDLYSDVTNFGAIPNEFNVGQKYSNTYGTIAMAKVGNDPNSATSQWFFNLTNNSANLDNQNGGFTVFGRVVDGTNVLEYFNHLAKWSGTVDLTLFYGSGSGAGLFTDLPVTYSGWTWPYFTNLIYVDITLLEVSAVKTSGGSTDISWNSVSNRTNTVYYTDQFPPSWQLLQSVLGNGQRQKVTDNGASSTKGRFYRVLVNYP